MKEYLVQYIYFILFPLSLTLLSWLLIDEKKRISSSLAGWNGSESFPLDKLFFSVTNLLVELHFVELTVSVESKVIKAERSGTEIKQKENESRVDSDLHVAIFRSILKEQREKLNINFRLSFMILRRIIISSREREFRDRIQLSLSVWVAFHVLSLKTHLSTASKSFASRSNENLWSLGFLANRFIRS